MKKTVTVDYEEFKELEERANKYNPKMDRIEDRLKNYDIIINERLIKDIKTEKIDKEFNIGRYFNTVITMDKGWLVDLLIAGGVIREDVFESEEIDFNFIIE